MTSHKFISDHSAPTRVAASCSTASPLSQRSVRFSARPAAGRSWPITKKLNEKISINEAVKRRKVITAGGLPPQTARPDPDVRKRLYDVAADGDDYTFPIIVVMIEATMTIVVPKIMTTTATLSANR